MKLRTDAIDRDGSAFGRAFASARACALNPEARVELHRAVSELVASGALLPQEARDFEDTLITSEGRLLNSRRALGLAEQASRLGSTARCGGLKSPVASRGSGVPS